MPNIQTSSRVELFAQFNTILSSGLVFEDHEEHLKFRLRLLNAVMLTAVFFSAMFVVLNWIGFNELGSRQLIATELHFIGTIVLITLLYKRKYLYPFVSGIFVLQSLVVFISALIFVVNDELRIVWFYIHIWVVYILLGKSVGVFSTGVVLMSLIGANYYLPQPFSNNAMVTALISLCVTSVVSYAYTSRAIAYFQRLTDYNHQLQELASKDPLTGVLNPRTYYEIANRVIHLSIRSNTPFAVLFIDLDHFKHINDRYGHEMGDTVLRAVANTLNTMIRRSDILGRIGGEEFSAFLPDTSCEGAVMLAEKLRHALENLEHKLDNGEILRITASFGVAAQRHGEHSIAELQRRADQAMYLAKMQGRNRVMLAEDEVAADTGLTSATSQATTRPSSQAA